MSAPKFPYMALDDWKAKALDGEAPKDVQLRKTVVFEKAEDVEGEPDTVRIIITTNQRDRQRDVVEVSGWNITEFLANPVVMWAHDYGTPPVARSPRIERQTDRLIGFPEFTSRDLYPFGHMIGQMVRQGFINAASVGFSPDEWTIDEEARGLHFLSQTLLEFSLCGIPANPGCLVEARALGLDLTPLKAWAEQTLDAYHETAGLWVPRQDLEVAYVTLNDGKLISLPSSEVILRSGRVLSAKNETAVRDAVAAIEGAVGRLNSLLDALPQPTEAEAEPEAAIETDALPAVSLSPMEPDGARRSIASAPSSPLSEQTLDGEYVELADEPDDGLIDINPEDLAAAIRDTVRASLMAVTGRLD